MQVKEWFLSAPPAIRTWMAGPVFRRFVEEQLAKSFQMIGKYDGAMSEECKQLCRQEHEAIGMLLGCIVLDGETP